MMTDSLAEAMHGRDWRRRVYRATCSACHGSGGADGGTLRCSTCDGKGAVWAAKANDGRCVYCGGEPMKGASLSPSHEVCKRCFAWLAAGNPMPTRGACPRCKGEGVVDCETCHNDGDDSRGCAACDDEGTTTCGACKGTKVTVYYDSEEGDE